MLADVFVELAELEVRFCELFALCCRASEVIERHFGVPYFPVQRSKVCISKAKFRVMKERLFVVVHRLPASL